MDSAMTFHINYINASHCQVETQQDILLELIADYTFRIDGWKFHPLVKAGRWDGIIRCVYRNGMIPTGLVPEVIKWAQERNQQISLSPDFSLFKTKIDFIESDLKLPFPLRDYQSEAIKLALDKKRQTLLLATSAGKSAVIYALARVYEQIGLKTLVIVPNVSLISQIESDFKIYSKLNGYDVNGNCHFISAGISKHTQKRIVCSTWQSLQALLKTEQGIESLKVYDAIICDEVHLASATVIGKLMNAATNAFFRIGLSGTLDNSKTNHKTITGLFGPIRKIVGAKELMDAGHVTRAIIKPIILKYDAPTCNAVSGLPYNDELDVIVRHIRRNKFIVEFANGLKGNSLFLFRFVDKHAELIKFAIERKYPDKKVHIVTKNTPKVKREELRALIEKSTNNVIISTYALFSTGVSINNLDSVVFASPTASSVKVLQSIGRSLRKHEGKSIATIYDIVDDMRVPKQKPNHLYKHYSSRLATYKKEQFDVSVINLEFGKKS
jgi:superfamily II DNA or RNA helicase